MKTSPTYSNDIKSRVDGYVQDVLSGEIPTGEWQRKAVERYLDDLEHAAERGLHFDEEAAIDVCHFFETYLVYFKGRWAGKPFKLAPWQAFILFNLFGWMDENDLRRYRTGYIEIARKNGKTTFAAGIALYLLIADGEVGADIYSAATKKDQARLVHNYGVKFVRRSEGLRKVCNFPKRETTYGALTVPSTGSKFEALSAEADTLDGLDIHGAVVDELHAHKNRRVWDVITTATDSRTQPLIVAITTAGVDRESVCYEQRDYTQKILDGVFNDDTFFGFVCSIDEDDDWLDEDNWRKANPNLGVSVFIKELRRRAEKAKRVPAEENTFRRYELCQWTEQENRWLAMSEWRECVGPFEVYGDLREALEGLPCCVGLDLASTTDLAALALVFPIRDRSDEIYAVLPYFWIPEDKAREKEETDRVPYLTWERHGFVYTTPGNVIDYRFIRHKINELNETYAIQEIAADRWGATELVQHLREDDGFTIAEFGQGYASMSPPTKELLTFVLQRKLIHGDNPVLSWMASNMTVKMDPAGNVKPDRSKARDKIDGIVALIMGLDRAIRHADIEPSVYKSRGFISLG